MLTGVRSNRSLYCSLLSRSAVSVFFESVISTSEITTDLSPRKLIRLAKALTQRDEPSFLTTISSYAPGSSIPSMRCLYLSKKDFLKS